MRDYELRRGHWKNIDGDALLHLMQDVFGETKTEDKGYVVENFGALQRLYVEKLGKTHLRVDTVMNPKVAGEESQKTIRAYYDFLELATGYNAKERQKRLKKEIEKEGEAPEV
ncbi:MAG TPA: DUF5611 family protein [Candidatus Thermoplasmatota archaeon]|nr:DUF5611 family protein [Candidatus Thermoplasmatota archaeon]